jgi:ppGpp synthetase/RelA/SpoT-type nucleotidyltranferase
MREPTLPMSRSALDRLGERLKSADHIAEDDLDSLAQVADVHQGVLDDLKDELAGLGYAATTRVKTTATLIEKLRREGSMLLSRVQDLGGARVIVPNRPAQDDAIVKIHEHFEASGHRCKIVDRRRNPSHGYRGTSPSREGRASPGRDSGPDRA